MFTPPLHLPADPSTVPFTESSSETDVDLQTPAATSPERSASERAASDTPRPSETPAPLSMPWLKLQLQDTPGYLLSRIRPQAHDRCKVLEARSEAADTPGLRDAMRSRLWVVKELMAQVPDPVEDPRTVGASLRVFRDAHALMDMAERVLDGGYRHSPEAVRVHCLEGACESRLAPELDPDFLSRVVRCDLRPPEEAIPFVLENEQHPYRDFRPRFSCWKDAPMPPALDDRAVHPVELSSDQFGDIWDRLGEHGVINAMTAARALLHDRDSDPADVEAVVAQWLTVGPVSLDALFGVAADVLVLRTGSAAAERVFGARPEHQQALYCPGQLKLFIGVKATGDRREVPAARCPSDDGQPSRFWLEHARMLVRDGWCEAAQTPLPEMLPLPPKQGQPVESALGLSSGALKLRSGTFLQALADAAGDEPLGFPLGRSEEECQAIVVARYLLGQPLPRILESYVARRMIEEGFVRVTVV